MKPIPIEKNDLEISFELCEITACNETELRIRKIRSKIKKLQSDGEKGMLINLCEILIDIVENWDNSKSVSLIDKAIHCLQKANVFLARQKQKFFDKKNK